MSKNGVFEKIARLVASNANKNPFVTFLRMFEKLHSFDPLGVPLTHNWREYTATCAFPL